MSDELTPKQEAFCLAYLETSNAAEAYRRAYDVEPAAKDGWIYVEASQILDNPKITLRLKELRDQAARLSIFTVSKAFEEYEEARLLANKANNPSAAVSAVNGKVKLFGLDQPQKIEHTGANRGPLQFEGVPAAQRVLERLAELEQRSGAAGETATE